MRMRLQCNAGVLSLLLLAAMPAVAASSLRAVALGSVAGQLTLEMRLSRPVAPRISTLSDPRRVVLDFAGTRQVLRGPLPAAQAPVKAIRVAARPDGAVRVVLELEDGASAALLPSRQAATGESLVQLGIARTGAVVRAGAGAGTTAVAVSRAAATHAPANDGRDIIVAVDAGHGGTDPGASGRGGTAEKSVTLAIARALAREINAQPGMRALLTRDSDTFIPLRERALRARRGRADLFVSIHADAVLDRAVDGASVYVLSERGASSEAARILADRENEADLKGVSLASQSDALASVLVDLSQTAAQGASAEAAGRVLTALDQVGAVRRKEVQQAGFAVLKSPDVPSLLVETAYISNPTEERKLRNADYQRRLALAIASGIGEFFRQHPPDGTRYAVARAAAASRVAMQTP